eukprot:gene13331-19170_t
MFQTKAVPAPVDEEARDTEGASAPKNDKDRRGKGKKGEKRRGTTADCAFIPRSCKSAFPRSRKDARALGKSVSMNPSLSLNGDPPGDQEDFPDYMDMLLMYDCAHHKKSAAEWMSDIKRVGDRSVIVTERMVVAAAYLI